MTLIYLTVAYLAGVVLGQWAWQGGWLGCDVPRWAWLAAAALLPLTVLLQRDDAPPAPEPPLRWPVSAGFAVPRSRFSVALWVAIGVCVVMGVLRYASMPPTGCRTPADLAAFNLPADAAFDRSAPQVRVYGYIENFPVVEDDRQALVLRVHELDTGTGPQPVNGRVRLLTGPSPLYRYGEPLAVTGRLVDPPVFEDFSYRDYLARQGINSLVQEASVTPLDMPRQGPRWRQILADWRSRGLVLLQRALPEPYAALAAGILLGIDTIPATLYERFNATGASHVLVISGSNVTLIAAALLLLSRRLMGRWAVPVTLAGITTYALFVGGEPTVWRAALMGSLVVVALAVGRRSTAVVSLAVAAWLMALLNPHVVWDVGFQLSAMATLGLVVYGAPLLAWVGRRWSSFQGGIWPRAEVTPDVRLRAVVVEIVVLSLAANLLTMPLIVYHFKRLSLISLMVNLLIVPVQPLILGLGTVGLLVGMVGAFLPAQLLLWGAWLGLYWTERVVSLSSTLPLASVPVEHFGLGALIGVYGVLLAVQTRHSWLDRVGEILAYIRPTRLTDNRSLTGLAMAVILVWTGVSALPDGRLHVYFLDIGQGDGIFIQTPEGRQVLIDGGASRDRLLTQLGEVMPFWDRSIDVLLLTHPDRDHMGAQVAVPERYDVDLALDTQANRENPDADAWRASLTDAYVPIREMRQGGWIDLGNGVALWVLWPPSDPIAGSNADNENSLVTKLVYGDFSVLLTGDAGLPSEAAWIDQELPIDATVLKVGHHGSANSTGRALVEAVDPDYAVIQVGPNSYGHPTEIVLETLAGRAVLRNDQDGRIHLSSDGEAVWVQTTGPGD